MPVKPSDKPLHEEVLDVFLDPVLAGFVQDLEGGLQAMQKTRTVDDHREVTTLICELTRDVLFRLGPVEEIQTSQARETVERIAGLFQNAAETVKPEGDPLIQAFRDHIRERAEILLGKKNAYEASGSYRT
jgi:hypothetical protein